MSATQTFLAAVLAREAKAEDIVDWVAAWDEGFGKGQDLPDYLGMELAEYAAWGQDPEQIYRIVGLRLSVHLGLLKECCRRAMWASRPVRTAIP